MTMTTSPAIVPGATYHENRPPESVRNAEPAWIGQLDPKDLLVYVHVPKAGGTSFNAVLWQVYGRHFLNYHRRLSGWSPASFTRRRAASMLAVGGHFPYGFHKEFGRPYHRWLYGDDGVLAGRRLRYVTIVRNPVDKVRSFYRFVTTFPTHSLYEQTRGMSAKEFFKLVQSVGNLEWTNQQCYLVGGLEVREFAPIRQRLIDDYHAICALEDVVPFVEHLRQTLHWPDVYELKHRNQSPKAKDDDEFDAETLDWIRANNAEDMKLYEFARTEARKYWKS
ncbi:MAG: sulfotransferase family 2 domain-containing protein [Pseudomonadota bacterium]